MHEAEILGARPSVRSLQARSQVRLEQVEEEAPLEAAVEHRFGVETGSETFVVPLEAVVECVERAPVDGVRATGVMNLRGEAVPCIRLRHWLGVGGELPSREEVLVVQYRERRVGLVADRLLGQGQTVVKPLGPLFRRVPGLAGSTILGNGHVGLLLDVPALVAEADNEGART